MKRRAALTLVAGGFAAAPRMAFGQTTSMALATIPIDATASVFYARETGAFAKAGLDVTIQTMNNGGAIAAAVASGAMAIGASNVASIAEAHARGLPFVIVAPAAQYVASAPTSVLMVPLNSPIRTAKDLEGKTIAVTGLKTISQFAPMAWIDKNGAQSSTVQWIEVGPPALPAALAQGRVDAAVVLEPFVQAAKRSARILAPCFDAVAPRFLLSGYFTTRDYAQRNADAIRRFQQAMRETNAWANKNDDASATILVKYTSISAEAARSMVRATYPDAIDDALIQPILDVAAKYGGTPRFTGRDVVLR